MTSILSTEKSAMSIKSGRKGMRIENEIAHRFQDEGFAAEKISGMYRPGPDITVPLLGIDRAVEVKSRADGFRELYKWLQDRDFLIVRADRQQPLVVLPLRLAIEIARLAERAKDSTNFACRRRKAQPCLLGRRSNCPA
jgi:hypothetical protein